MNVLGVHLTMLIGPTVPVPAPIQLTENLASVEIRHGDEGRSGFQLTFHSERFGLVGLTDYPLLRHPLLRPFRRVILVVRFTVEPHVLMDGIITQQQLAPGDGVGRITVTGEDVSYAMDRDERTFCHPAQSDATVVAKLLASYPQYGLIPEIHKPEIDRQPGPTEPVPTQHATDLGHLQEMAAAHGFVFYVSPGRVVGTNNAYWGPPQFMGAPQRALSVNLGSATNVESIDFSYDGLAPTLYEGWITDVETERPAYVRTDSSGRPRRATEPALAVHYPMVRRRQFREDGLTAREAKARAQALTDASTDAVVTASGQLDALRYGDLLWPRRPVGVRGVGHSHDGLYYVKSVSHSIRRGEYRQSFTLTREGLGSTVSRVVV